MERDELIRIVTAAQAGDKDALNTLFNNFYNSVYYFALKTVKDETLACDITQETFIEVINTIGRLQEPAAFVTWLKRITYHQCTRYFKKKKDVLVEEDEEGNTLFDKLEEERTEFIPDAALDQADFKQTILGMLDTLSEEQRSAVILYYFEELSVRQIAEVQGVSEGTVKSRLNYARKSIRSSVESYERKHNIKLHSIGILPLLKWILGGALEGMPTLSASLAAEGVSAATGVSITLSAGSAAATTVTVAAGAGATTAATTATATVATGAGAATATTAAATGTGLMAKLVALPVAAKVIAVITAGAVAVTGGTTTAVLLTNGDLFSGLLGGQTTSSSPEAPSGLSETLPAGCVYTTADGTVLREGDPFPAVCTQGDLVAFGDYLYAYEGLFTEGQVFPISQWKDYDDLDLTYSDLEGGWFVVVADKTKEHYGTILSRINGKPIRHLYGTFWGCKNLTAVEDILPEEVEFMISTFGESGLRSTAGMKIPDSVRSMHTCFYSCLSLTEVTHLPPTVENLTGTFWECENLTGSIEILGTPKDYDELFLDTLSPINLVGDGDALLPLAKTSPWANISVNGTPVYESWTVPEGCRYQTVEGKTYSAGQTLSAPPQTGDELLTPDYTYRFNQSIDVTYSIDTNLPTFSWVQLRTNLPGWRALVRDRTKTAYSPLLTDINRMPLTDLERTFEACRNLTEAPELPATLRSLASAFEGCHSLTVAPTIPYRATDLFNAFSNCTALTAAPELPAQVDNLTQTFAGCTSLRRISNLPNSIRQMYGAFRGCTALEEIPALPENIQDIGYAFENCRLVETLPEIPASVQRMSFAFSHCVSLSGQITVNAKLDDAIDCGGQDECCALDGRKCVDCFICNPAAGAFLGTVHPIRLTGQSPDLCDLAASSPLANVLAEGYSPDLQTAVSAAAETFLPYIKLSGLPYFNSSAELTDSNRLWFAFALWRALNLYPGEFLPQPPGFLIPVDPGELDALSEQLFGKPINFSAIPNGEFSPYAANIEYYFDGMDRPLRFIEMGGAGDDGHRRIGRIEPLDENSFQLTVLYCYMSAEPPEEGSNPYLPNDTGYSVAIQGERVILTYRNGCWSLDSFLLLETYS
ncbi:MAG: sigma-70 family RNA polymerase sigma factor [Oscillospiraceae bacterium]|nr:sigma-70 family RNA polymerase sigma factor [Oscillospiraceae bacterium]